jgi:hypothetical protein
MGQTPMSEIEIETRQSLTKDQFDRLLAVLVEECQLDAKWQQTELYIKELQYKPHTRIIYDCHDKVTHFQKHRIHRVALNNSSKLHLCHEKPVSYPPPHLTITARRLKHRWVMGWGELVIHITHNQRQQEALVSKMGTLTDSDQPGAPSSTILHHTYLVEIEWNPTNANATAMDHAHLLQSKLLGQMVAINTLLGILAN